MLIRRIINYIYAKTFCLIFSNCFGYFGKNVRVIFPLDIQGMKNIQIQKNVRIGYKTWLASKPINQNYSSLLEIGEGTFIGNFNHIFCTNSIKIGNKVLIADKVYISDNLHSYEDIQIPIINQKIKQISSVVIGDGSWLGENVCIVGVKIGKNCVIGANSVVIKDIPDYCVAVGSPAKVIKRFNVEKNIWERV